MTNQELDRERRSNYHVIIKATEECINPIDEQAAYNDTILDSSMLKINVQVDDIDDNPPQFIERVFTGVYANLNNYYQHLRSVNFKMSSWYLQIDPKNNENHPISGKKCPYFFLT